MITIYHKVLLTSIVFCLMLSGCATTAYYSTEQDPQIAFDKQEPITIFLGRNPSISDKKFGLLLGELMIEEGFSINGFNTESKQIPYALVFDIETKSSQYTGSYNYTTYNYSTQSTYIPGAFGNGYNPGTTITTTTQTPTTHTQFYTGTYVYKIIRIYVFFKNTKNEMEQLWYGGVSVGASAYSQYEKNTIRNLVKLIGQNHKGDLVISKDIWQKDAESSLDSVWNEE